MNIILFLCLVVRELGGAQDVSRNNWIAPLRNFWTAQWYEVVPSKISIPSLTDHIGCISIQQME